jgi:PAS domain S-box-containing protein
MKKFASTNNVDNQIDSSPKTIDECLALIKKLKADQLEQELANQKLQTEKEQTESELEKHITFYTYAPSGYFTLNQDGIILGYNQSASKFLSNSGDQLKGKKLHDFLDRYSSSVFDQFLIDVFNSNTKVSCKVALKSQFNISKNVQIEGIALPNGIECLVDMVDISGRIKILELLADSELKYQSLLDGLFDGVGIVDLDENFSYANPAGEVIFGVSPGDLKNRNLKEFLNTDQFSRIQIESEKREQGEHSRYELDIITQKGEHKTIFISGSPQYSRKGERIGTLGMFVDITEKKKDERELKRRLKLELIISEISNDFVHLKKEYLDLSVNRALQKIGSFAGVDRSYIFMFTDDGLFCNNTHEWCREGIEPQIENLKDVPLDLMPWWMNKLQNFETIHIPLVANLPPEAQAEKEILEAQDIKSLLVIPLLTANSLIGFLGFDSVGIVKDWQNQDVLLLTTLGEIIANGFGRIKYEDDLVLINTQLEQKVVSRTSELKRQLELNRVIVDNAGMIVISTDNAGIIRSFNPFAEEMLGYKASEVIGKLTPLRFHDPNELIEIYGSYSGGNEDSLDFMEISNASLNKGRNSEGSEWTYIRKDGSRFNALLKTSILEDERGNITGTVGVAIDISKRKMAETAQVKTLQNLTILIQNLQAGTLFEDETRHIYMVNQSFCEIFGINIPPEALVGFDCALASEGSKQMMMDPDRFIERIDEIISERRIVINDELYLCDGRVLERDYIPILLNDVLLGHLWQYRDITERKLNERYAIIQRDLGFSLAATSTIEEALPQVVLSTLLIDGIHAVGIYLFNSKTELFELVIHHGFSPEFVLAVESYNQEQIQYKIIQNGEPVYGFYNELIEGSDLFLQENLKQIGVIPIKYEDKVIGSVNFGSKSEERFKYSTRISLEIIAAQIGGTLARIKTENALKLSQRNFQLMFDTIDDFMFILNAEGIIIKSNPVVQRRLGYTHDELFGMSVLEVHPLERREEAAFIVGEMLAGRLEVCPVPLCKKNGELIPVETKVVFGKWDGKDALYGISRDITERLKAEETLRKSDERWQFALEGSGDGVWDWNILTNEVFYSKQWKEMLGYSIDEIENKLEEWKKCVYPDDIQACLADLEKHFNGETEVYVNEHRMLCKDGTYKWILDRGKVVEWTDKGQALRIIGTHSDITPRKLYEEQLKNAIEKERELNDLKSRFVSTTSHEFRTPLASILMVSDTLIAYQHKMDQIQIAGRLGKIKDQVFHLTNIVNDVLQLSKMQEGKIGFDPKEEDFVALCYNIIDGFNTTILVNSQITFSSPFESLIVRIDQRLIIQSITNLISNAIKYSSEDPRIFVELKLENDELIFTVQDFGIGIPEGDQKHLFTPFFRAGNASTIQGNGLGLSIVNESVQMHGGRVTFSSTPGKESRFNLHLPAALICS